MRIAAARVTWVAAALACQAMPAHALYLNFEDLAGTAPSFLVTAYHGFTFGTNDLATTAWFYSDQASPYYIAGSGSVFMTTDYSLYTSSSSVAQATQPITNPDGFIFKGASFSGSDTISYRLYLGSQLVYTSAASDPLTVQPGYVASNYAGVVDSVVIVGHQGYYAMDNFEYLPVAAEVPEPSTAVLAVFGLASVAAGLRLRAWRGAQAMD